MPSRSKPKRTVSVSRGDERGSLRYMSVLRRAVAGAAAAAFLSVGAIVTMAGPAAADDVECDGVTVVVEYDGDIDTGCATSEVENGLDALRDAGFDVEFVTGHAGMVCQINSEPSEAGECASAPSANSFWGYWHSDGDEWEFSNAGAGMRSPDAGTVEGWIFGDGGDEPGIDPAAAQAQAGETAPASDEPASDESASDDERAWWDTYSWLIAIGTIGLVIAGGLWSRQRQARRNDANR